jgi:hypothetical protein
MLTSGDIERCARTMIRQYGADAAGRARRHAEASRQKGAYGVHAIWVDVAAVVERLLAQMPIAGEPAAGQRYQLSSWRRRRF